MSVEELEKAALAKGFEHPGLIGLHSDPHKGHPLAFWLNPYWGEDLPQKLLLQNKALERWGVLKSGGVVEGMDLAAYLAAHPLEEDESAQGGAQLEILTPEELNQLLESKNEALAVCQNLYAKASEPGDTEKGVRLRQVRLLVAPSPLPSGTVLRPRRTRRRSSGTTTPGIQDEARTFRSAASVRPPSGSMWTFEARRDAPL